MAASNNTPRDSTFVDLQLLTSCHEVLALQGFTATGDGTRNVQLTLPPSTDAVKNTITPRNPVSSSASYYGHLQPVNGYPLVSTENAIWTQNDQGQDQETQQQQQQQLTLTATTSYANFSPTTSATYFNYGNPIASTNKNLHTFVNVGERTILETVPRLRLSNDVQSNNLVQPAFRKPMLQDAPVTVTTVFQQPFIPKLADDKCIVCQNIPGPDSEYANIQETREIVNMNGLEITLTSRSNQITDNSSPGNFVSLKRLADLLGIPSETLQTGNMPTNLSRLAEVSPVFCHKCSKLAALADILERKLKETTHMLLQSIPLYSNNSNTLNQADTSVTDEPPSYDEMSVDSSNCLKQERLTQNNPASKTQSPKLPSAKKRGGGSKAKVPKNYSDPDKPYAFLCEQCGQGFDSVNAFATHYKKLHPELKFPEKYVKEKPFVCQECDASFATRGYLTVHLKIHSNERNFKCPKCERNFVRKLDFEMHMNRHNGIRPFVCKMCDKRFFEKSNLIHHGKVHNKPPKPPKKTKSLESAKT